MKEIAIKILGIVVAIIAMLQISTKNWDVTEALNHKRQTIEDHYQSVLSPNRITSKEIKNKMVLILHDKSIDQLERPIVKSFVVPGI